MKLTEGQREHAYQEHMRRREEFIARRVEEMKADPAAVCEAFVFVIGPGGHVDTVSPMARRAAHRIAGQYIDGDALSFDDELRPRVEARMKDLAGDEFDEAEGD